MKAIFLYFINFLVARISTNAFSPAKTLLPLRLPNKDLMPHLLPTLGDFGTIRAHRKPQSRFFFLLLSGHHNNLICKYDVIIQCD